MNALKYMTIMLCFTFFNHNVYGTPKPSAPDYLQKEGAVKAEPIRSVAIFAGGCFWCMEKPFDQVDGVTSTISGYTGGEVLNPTYRQVSAGGTGHYEVLKVEYDPSEVSYEQLLDVFWLNVDPVDDTGQFCDKGSQYLSAIFVANSEERAKAEASLQSLEESGSASGEIKKGSIKTEILPAAVFYPAEEYHQNYYKKNPVRYYYYRNGCGRDKRLKTLWE